MSKGEEKILNILKKEHIKVEREKTFNDLKHGLLRFDFYLPQYNAIIEYNGQQHYYRVNKFQKNNADFKRQQEHDRKKISYCLANGITIYCIPYWEFDNLSKFSDLTQQRFKAKTRWKNDDDWQIFNKEK